MHLRCFTQYPEEYLGPSPPSLRLDDATMIDHGSAETLKNDVAAIFSQCAHDRRPALELVLRYLLGEFDRDGIFRLLKNTRELHSDSFPLDGFDSSDEDEDGDEIDTRGLELSDGALKTPHPTFNVPLPRISGALWANDGRLFYFLPRKEDKPVFILDNFDHPGAQKAFSSFGRLSRTSGGRHPFGSVANATDDTLSDDEEDSSSSGTSDIIDFSEPRFISPLPWSNEVVSHQRNKELSIGDSHRSSSGPKLSQSHHSSCGSIVSIIDVQDILPQSRQLGEQYTLSADLSQCCQQNSHVAENLGYREIADSWLLLDLIICDPKNRRATSTQKDSNVTLEAQSTNVQLKQSRHLKAYPTQESPGKETSWRAHPFASQWLLKSLFLHFDQLANVQTLAVMLCILSKAELAPPSSLEAGHKSPQQYINDVDESTITVSSLSNPSPSRHMQASERRANTYAPRIEFEAPNQHTPYLHSADSSWGERFRSLSSTQDLGGVSPTSFQDIQNFHHGQRSNTTLTGALAGSLPRHISLATSASTSPGRHARKGSSPSGSFTQVYSSLIAKRAPNLLGKLSVTTAGSSHALPPMTSETHSIPTPKKRPKFQSRLKNQNRFFEQGYNEDRHLSPVNQEQRKAIIHHYAELLEVWGLVEARIMLLKQFSSSAKRAARSMVDSIEPFTFGKSSVNIRSISPSIGPQLALQCGECGCSTTLLSGGKCPNCSSGEAPLACVLCHGIVSGLSIPCLSCGHLLHLECRRLLDSSILEVAGDVVRQQNARGCVAGCDCPCPSVSNIGVQPLLYRQRCGSEGTATIKGESALESLVHFPKEDFANQKDPDGPAYESLARNLGKKRLASRPSQIWRGWDADERVNRQSVSSNLRTGSYNS